MKDVIVRAEVVVIGVERVISLAESFTGVKDLTDNAVYDVEELLYGRGSRSGDVVVVREDRVY